MYRRKYKAIGKNELFVFYFVPANVRGFTYEIAREFIGVMKRSNSSLASILLSVPENNIAWEVFSIPESPETLQKTSMGLALKNWADVQKDSNNLWIERTKATVNIDSSGKIQKGYSTGTTEIIIMIGMLKK